MEQRNILGVEWYEKLLLTCMYVNPCNKWKKSEKCMKNQQNYCYRTHIEPLWTKKSIYKQQQIIHTYLIYLLMNEEPLYITLFARDENYKQNILL